MAHSQPIASSSQIQSTPSRQDGLSSELEADLRTFGAITIQQAGVLLKIPQVVVSTASVLFQRFWFVSSMKQFGSTDIALSCLFLSSKLEEHPLRLRDLINVFDYLGKKVDHEKAALAMRKVQERAQALGSTSSSNTTKAFTYEPMEYFAKGFYDVKEDAVIGEMQLLKRLGFNLTLQHPYGFLVNYLQVLSLTDHPTIPQLAWNFANDSLLTPLPAMHPPNKIAITSIYLAAHLSQNTQHPIQLPLEPRPWWELFGMENERVLWSICDILLAMYDRWGGMKPIAEGGESVWARAAGMNLPLTKSAVRARLS